MLMFQRRGLPVGHLVLLLLALAAPQHTNSFSPSRSAHNARTLPHRCTLLFASTPNEDVLAVSSSQVKCNRRTIVTRVAAGAALFVFTSEKANAEASAKVAVSSETKLALEVKSQPTQSKSPSADKSTPKNTNKLENPGDVKNCSDFDNYKDAKTWFDKYYDLYGDVAKLDKNNNLIPCESLPGAPSKKSK